MIEVEIKAVRFNGKIKDIETIDTFYFNGEDAEKSAFEFVKEYNSTMPFYTLKEHGVEGYDTAWKPGFGHVFSVTDILVEAFNDIRNSILALHLKDIRLDKTR